MDRARHERGRAVGRGRDRHRARAADLRGAGQLPVPAHPAREHRFRGAGHGRLGVSDEWVGRGAGAEEEEPAPKKVRHVATVFEFSDLMQLCKFQAKPASKATKPASKAANKPASKADAKPSSKASAKPASKAAKPASSAAAAKPASRAGSKKPASKVGYQATRRF